MARSAKEQRKIGKPFRKGKSGNPKGRPLGQRDYATIYKEALRKLAEAKDMTPEELEDFLHQSGLANAFKDFRFYKDTLDRLHGKPIEKTDLTSGGEKIEAGVVVLPAIESKSAKCNLESYPRATNRSSDKN